MKAIYRKHVAAGAFCLLLLATGCGSSSSRTNVEGTVTYRGKPVGEQTLTLYSAGGKGEFFTHKIPIGADGTFSGQGPDPGTYKVVIEESLQAQEGRKPAGGDAVVVPRKYRRAETTDLTWPIKAGPNRLEIKLTD